MSNIFFQEFPYILQNHPQKIQNWSDPPPPPTNPWGQCPQIIKYCLEMASLTDLCTQLAVSLLPNANSSWELFTYCNIQKLFPFCFGSGVHFENYKLHHSQWNAKHDNKIIYWESMLCAISGLEPRCLDSCSCSCGCCCSKILAKFLHPCQNLCTPHKTFACVSLMYRQICVCVCVCGGGGWGGEGWDSGSGLW